MLEPLLFLLDVNDLPDWIKADIKRLQKLRNYGPMALSRVVSEIFNVEKCRDIEIGVRGHSRSLKEVPFYTTSMVSY